MHGSRREMVRPILNELNDVRWLCHDFYEEKGFIPVSDVCDRLFWVPEPDEAPALRRRATRLIRKINDHVLGVLTGLKPDPSALDPSVRYPRAASLDQASKIVVVAGGSWKIRGLAKLLAHWRPDGRRFMNTLITDVTTAQKLLDLP